jgi:Holliday junction resolvase RusA-like endonuclease
MIITIPCEKSKDLPKSMNSMRDYRHRLWEIAKWRRKVGCNIHPSWTKKPFTKAHVICERHSSREQDFDNLVASFKSILDALVYHNVLSDDGPKVLTREYRWIKAKKGEYKIVLNITEV